MLSLHALFSAIKLPLNVRTMNQQGAGIVLGLAMVGEALADQLTDRF
jgi:hypothetical protein